MRRYSLHPEPDRAGGYLASVKDAAVRWRLQRSTRGWRILPETRCGYGNRLVRCAREHRARRRDLFFRLLYWAQPQNRPHRQRGMDVPLADPTWENHFLGIIY